MTEERHYRIKAVDSWFFRTARPASHGDVDATSMFPPLPPTVIGALRAAFARALGWSGRGAWNRELVDQLGDGPDDLGPLSFGPLQLQLDEKTLYPMPQHLLGRSLEQRAAASTRWPRFEALDYLAPSERPVRSDLGNIHVPVPAGRHKPTADQKPLKSPEDFWLTDRGMQSVLAGGLPDPEQTIHSSELWSSEYRTGLERDDDTRCAIEGQLYSPVHIRLKPLVSLTVSVKGAPKNTCLPPEIPFGGEGRLAEIKEYQPSLIPTNEPDGPALLILLGDADLYDEEGVPPRPGDSVTRLAAQGSGTIITACYERPRLVGGWSTLQHRSLALKPMLRAGSVFWLSEDAKLPPARLGSATAHGYGAYLRANPTP